MGEYKDIFRNESKMYYGIIGAHSSSQAQSDLGPVYPPRKQSRCVTAMLLEVPVFLYGLLHLLAATFGLILLQTSTESSSNSSYSTTDEVELLIFGCLGSVTSSLALLAIWIRVRHLLVPLLLFTSFSTVFDAVTLCSYFTSTSRTFLESNVLRGYNVIPKYSQDVLFIVIGKLVISILLFRVVVSAYRRNLKLRGGRSPFRVSKKSSGSNISSEKEKMSASPKFQKKSHPPPQFGFVLEM